MADVVPAVVEERFVDHDIDPRRPIVWKRPRHGGHTVVDGDGDARPWAQGIPGEPGKEVRWDLARRLANGLEVWQTGDVDTRFVGVADGQFGDGSSQEVLSRPNPIQRRPALAEPCRVTLGSGK
jgi:hypothetical protein